MSVPFIEALARRDLAAASREIGASHQAWMADELVNFLTFRLAQAQARFSGCKRVRRTSAAAS